MLELSRASYTKVRVKRLKKENYMTYTVVALYELSNQILFKPPDVKVKIIRILYSIFTNYIFIFW